VQDLTVALLLSCERTPRAGPYVHTFAQSRSAASVCLKWHATSDAEAIAHHACAEREKYLRARVGGTDAPLIDVALKT
jgi:hypothetical protein